jgi:hypothetical protein
MSHILSDPLPKERKLVCIQTRRLMLLKLQVNAMQTIGAAPAGDRRVGLVAGGTFTGEKLNGTVLPGGADWIVSRPDGCMTLDVRLVLQTDDGALIGLTYRGLRHGPAEIMARVARGEPVDPSTYYFRTTIQFETASEKYGWLNRAFGIGIGIRTAAGPEYDIFELL